MQGQVFERFKVTVGGNLLVRGTLDATDIIARGDLSVRAGMIGKGRSLVKVSGAIDAKFIQHCRVAAKGAIRITNDVVNSTLYTMDALDAGNKGAIVGSEIFAFNSVRAGVIGRPNGPRASLHVGIDWTLSQESEQNDARLRQVAAKLEKVNAVSATDGPQSAKLQEIKARLADEYAKCTAKRDNLAARRIVNANAFIECSGTIAAGTAIEIAGAAYVVETPLTSARLALDAMSGRIVCTKLTAKKGR
jgi:uncharacterized protein (DUF342 family)